MSKTSVLDAEKKQKQRKKMNMKTEDHYKNYCDARSLCRQACDDLSAAYAADESAPKPWAAVLAARAECRRAAAAWHLSLWRDDDEGTLHDYKTGEVIRPATAEETAASRAAGKEGVISVEGRAVFVSR